MPIRDFKGEFAALREKELELRAQHAEQLVRLLQETGADELEPSVLAGLLVTGVNETDPTRIEEWRKHGEALFRPARQKRRKEPAPAPAPANGTRSPAASPAPS